ncbi:MAG: DNA ligase [Holophaga sp.]|nr:DNA ligase [Holophaga sp.]
MRAHATASIGLLATLLALVLSLAPARAGSPTPSKAHSILLANVLGPQVDPAGYLVSEKFDGVRATWDGKVLRFRSGREVPAPGWFTAKLPPQALDGELWLARGRFEDLSGFVRKVQPVDAEWQQIKFLVFELPGAPGPFTERAQRIQELVAGAQWPQLVAVTQFRVANRAELQRKLNEVVRGGGEGLMLHLADATYVTGRSDVLLKLKPLSDTEATVVEHLPGKGKYQGALGALRVEMPDGKRFVLGAGFTDAVRQNPPPVGTVITYTYRGLTKKGLPRCASYLRVRDTF